MSWPTCLKYSGAVGIWGHVAFSSSSSSQWISNFDGWMDVMDGLLISCSVQITTTNTSSPTDRQNIQIFLPDPAS